MLQNNYFSRLFLAILFGVALVWSMPTLALSFKMPQKGDQVVGVPQTTEVQDGEDLSDIALRYGIGFYEVYETNPGIDPDNPPTNTQLIIPTQYVLPPELKENLILVNLAEMRLYFRPSDSNTVYIFPVGIGKVDWDTSTGLMHVVEKVDHPAWIIPDSLRKYRAMHGDNLPRVIPPGPENPLGSYKLKLDSKDDIMIHGTNLPAGVGRRSSAGCIRLYEEDIKKLFHMVKVGTPVLIINQPYKAGWKGDKLYLEAHVPLLEQRLEVPAGDMTLAIDAIDKAKTGHKVIIDWQRAFRIANEHVGVPRPIN